MNNRSVLKRIAILGPESTGKTTLSAQLAVAFDTAWVPEYARAFAEALERPYTADDILHCAREQLRLEELRARAATGFLFCDTEFIILKVWAEQVFGRCPDFIVQQVKQHRYDLYLLTAPDLPFEKDPVRENPHRREELFALYEAELKTLGVEYAVISGIGKERLQQAAKAVRRRV
jgi:NadR type nicotinamide-nucleotide adenylyltransferase